MNAYIILFYYYIFSYIHISFCENNIELDFKAYVMNMNIAIEHWKHTQKELLRINKNIKIIRIVPFNKTDKIVTDFCQFNKFPQYKSLDWVASNLLTNFKIWDIIANDKEITNNQWNFIFEDDFTLHPDINPKNVTKIIHKLFEVANENGFAYFRLCGPKCHSNNSFTDNGVVYAKCNGRCIHAYALQKKRAKSLKEYLREKWIQHGKKYYPESGGHYFFTDVQFDVAFNTNKVYLAGLNFVSPQSNDHRGIFYQDRKNLPIHRSSFYHLFI